MALIDEVRERDRRPHPSTALLSTPSPVGSTLPRGAGEAPDSPYKGGTLHPLENPSVHPSTKPGQPHPVRASVVHDGRFMLVGWWVVGGLPPVVAWAR